jgi:hypothetical protein
MEQSASRERKKRTANTLPFVMLLALIGWVLYLWHHPIQEPVGTYIGALAFVGAVVSIVPPENSWSKAACFLVFGAFLVLEVTTLYHQRAEDRATDLAKRKEEDDRFAGLLRAQQKSFTDVLDQNQREFSATMGEVKGGPGYVFFFAMARETGELPLMMVNNNKVPIRGVDLEIINVVPKDAPDNFEQYKKSILNPRVVHIGDVQPGFKQTEFTLPPGKYFIKISTRLGVFNERLEAIRGASVPGGWHQEFCLMKENSSKILEGKCDD